FHSTSTGGRLATTHDLTIKRNKQAPYTVDLQWNWVSNLEPSGPKDRVSKLGSEPIFAE
ncbi:hypothetical protein AVEN_254964-1, partial [Araneus ventricosus]